MCWAPTRQRRSESFRSAKTFEDGELVEAEEPAAMGRGGRKQALQVSQVEAEICSDQSVRPHFPKAVDALV